MKKRGLEKTREGLERKGWVAISGMMNGGKEVKDVRLAQWDWESGY